MDRVTTYTLALGRSTDFLQAQQDSMVGNAYSNQMVLGAGSVTVDGLALTQTTVASLVLNLGLGAIYAPANLEATTWSVLPANTTTIIKQGLLQAVDPITFTPPATTGYSQNFLVQVQYADLDTLPVLLPFYNTATPSTPYQGPNNSGASSPTVRQGIVSVNVKAGTAANSGSQTTPTPDAGWTGLYVVTVPNGATQLTSGNVAVFSGAPFLPVRLPGVPAGVLSGQWEYAAASGTNTYTATVFATAAYPAALTVGMEILVYFSNTNTSTSPTLNLNGLGAQAIVKQGGGAPSVGDIALYMSLIWSGSNWRVNGFVTSDILALIASKVPTRLTGNTTLYVNAATGLDTNPGTSAAPFKTINAALLYANLNINLNGYVLTIQAQDTGTVYAPFTVPGPLANSGGTGGLTIQGNTTTPANTTINGGSTAVTGTGGAQFGLSGFKLVSGSGYGILCVGAGTLINFSAVQFDYCALNHIHCSGGSVGITGNYTITGGAQRHYYTYLGGTITNSGTQTVTLTGTPGFASFFAQSDQSGSMSFSGLSYSGAATGQRYAVNLNGVINTAGGGANFFPGSVAGATASGGQYV